MPKEFGKFTSEQIYELINVLPQVQEARTSYLAGLRNNPHKLNEKMPEPFKWSWAYDLPIAEHLAKLAIECDVGEHLVALTTTDDPQQAFLDDMKAKSDPAPIPKNTQPILALLEALACTLECVVIYGRYINDIIADVKARVAGSDDWLFKAIRIDPNVITCDTTQDRLCRAILLDDKDFLHELQLALGGKTGSQAKYLNDFRLLMQILSESETPDLLDSQINELVLKLGIYKNTGDAQHNVSELIRKYKKTKNHFKS